MFPITRYSIKNASLVPWIKFIWCFSAENTEIHNKLLPTDCIDLIINLSDAIIYKTESREFAAAPLHVNGLRDKHSYIFQSGSIRVFGISFYSFGLYPFIRKPLVNIQNRIVDLNTLSSSLAQKLMLAVSDVENSEIVINIENALCSELQIHKDDEYNTGLINKFMEADVTIKFFCEEERINLRTFERMVLRYAGYPPKILRRIKRFQSASNQLVHQTPEHLSDLAYDNGFTDQAHLIKDFQKFSAAPPGVFYKEKATIKENTCYSYV